MNSVSSQGMSGTEADMSQKYRRFVSEQGIMGETVPPDNQRHPFWQFEGEQLARYQAYVCCFVLFLAGILCAAGGIGGGGIYVTLLMVAGKQGVADAVPLSKAIVFFGSISSLVLNSRKLVAWETKRETAIDYNICRLVVPGSLSGTLIGVILNRRLPSWIILLVLAVILVGITVSVGWTTVRLYLEEWAQDLEDEQAAAEASKHLVEATKFVSEKAVREQAPPGTGPSAVTWSAAVKTDNAGTEELIKPRRASGIRRPSLNAPDVSKMRNKMLWSDIVLALLILFVVITAGVLRFHSGECHRAGVATQGKVCSHPTLFWLGRGTLESWMQHPFAITLIRRCTIAVPLCACILVELWYARLLMKRERWRLKDVLLYWIVATLTGCLSGLVGIGGGLIFSPFFLVSGVHPSVAVATSSTCVIFTSASTSLQYLFTDRIIVSLTLVYGSISLFASYVGTSFVHFLEERFWGKKSYVSAIVLVGVFISTVLSIVKLVCMASAH